MSCIIVNGVIKPNDIIEALENKNIESRPIWKPMHLQPFFERFDYVGDNVSEVLFEKGVCLPSDTKMTDEDLEKVCMTIRNMWTTKMESQCE